MVIFNGYINLPEGISIKHPQMICSCDGAIGKPIHLETQQNMRLVTLRENLYPENEENP
jgi:hypothetical protein